MELGRAGGLKGSAVDRQRTLAHGEARTANGAARNRKLRKANPLKRNG